jgi:hypothetical protein
LSGGFGGDVRINSLPSSKTNKKILFRKKKNFFYQKK